MSQKPAETEETDNASAPNLTKYFDSSTPTVFDEIVSSTKQLKISSTNTSSKFNMPPETPSGNITVLDEIISSTKQLKISSTNTSSKFNMPPGTPSGNIFENDSSFEEPSEHATINDYHRDAWIPSENTRKILRTIATSTGNNHVDRENLTMPGLAISDEMTDPIKEAVTYFLGEEETINRNVSTLSDVTQVTNS